MTRTRRITRSARRTLAALLLLAGMSNLAVVASGDPTTAPARKPTSVRDSPGWYPSVDPESTSVLIGRRTNAPVVKKPFHGGARSLDDLGRTVCRLLHHGAKDSLLSMCVGADEFRDILWREFPQSRPATGLQWEDAWNIMGMRLQTGCSGAVNDLGGRYLQFVRFETADTTMRFKNFKLHRGLTLVARNDEGGEERMTWLRSVAERRGSFKIFGVDD
jgi:hypothetical protein